MKREVISVLKSMQNDMWDVLLRAELEQVYRRHRQTLFSLALTVTGCSGLAEDAVHEAFLRLCQKAQAPSGSLVAYVFSAVRNAAIDCRRRQERQQSLAVSIFENSIRETDLPADGCASAELRSQLVTSIEALDEPERQIIVMKVFGGLTFDEIGQVLETPSATAATRYRRAIMKLEETLRRSP